MTIKTLKYIVKTCLFVSIQSLLFNTVVMSSVHANEQSTKVIKLSASSSSSEVDALLKQHNINGDKVSAFYQNHPELFSARKVYSLQNINIEGSADEFSQAKSLYLQSETFGELTTLLKQNNIAFKPSSGNVVAEDLPSDFLHTLSKLSPGQTIDVLRGEKLMFVQLLRFVEEPKSLAEATPAIKLHLLNKAINSL